MSKVDLLGWVIQKGRVYGCSVFNWSSSGFKNGNALLAVVCSIVPDVLKYNDICVDTVDNKIEKVLSTIEQKKWFDIRPFPKEKLKGDTMDEDVIQQIMRSLRTVDIIQVNEKLMKIRKDVENGNVNEVDEKFLKENGIEGDINAIKQKIAEHNKIIEENKQSEERLASTKNELERLSDSIKAAESSKNEIENKVMEQNIELQKAEEEQRRLKKHIEELKVRINQMPNVGETDERRVLRIQLDESEKLRKIASENYRKIQLELESLKRKFQEEEKRKQDLEDELRLKTKLMEEQRKNSEKKLNRLKQELNSVLLKEEELNNELFETQLKQDNLVRDKLITDTDLTSTHSELLNIDKRRSELQEELNMFEIKVKAGKKRTEIRRKEVDAKTAENLKVKKNLQKKKGDVNIVHKELEKEIDFKNQKEMIENEQEFKEIEKMKRHEKKKLDQIKESTREIETVLEDELDDAEVAENLLREKIVKETQSLTKVSDRNKKKITGIKNQGTTDSKEQSERAQKKKQAREDLLKELEIQQLELEMYEKEKKVKKEYVDEIERELETLKKKSKPKV